MCMSAATHISSISACLGSRSYLSDCPAVSVYNENFCLKRSPAFLSYYIFTAGYVMVKSRLEKY